MTTARELMHQGAQCIREEQSLAQAAQMMRDMNVGSLPICGSDDRLRGIITDRDIVLRCVAEGKDANTCTAGELAMGKPVTVDANADVEAVLASMSQHQIRRMPVIDNHRLVGMISEADLARGLSEEQLSRFVTSVYAG